MPYLDTNVFFLSEGWKCYPSEAVSPFFALEMRERKAYIKKDKMKRVCPSQQGLRFKAGPIQAGFPAHCLMIICKYLSLSHKLDYQVSGLAVVPLFQWFK